MIIIPVEVFDVSRSKVSESLTVSILRIPLGTGCMKSDCTGKIAVFIKQQLASGQGATVFVISRIKGRRRIIINTFVTSDRPAFRQVERNAESAA